MSKREVNRQRIIQIIEKAFRDRIADYPLESYEAEKDVLISQVAEALEESCYLASYFGQTLEGVFNVPYLDVKGFPKYITLCATFIAHLAPHFYTARHSFIYRDMLLRNELRDRDGSIPDAINIALQEINYLWPEIFDNPYLEPKDSKMVMETREVEIALVHTMLNEMIKTKIVPTFESALSDSLQTVCMGKGQQCWNRSETKVIIPCGDADAACNFEKLSYCMPYEDFLMHFAANEMRGDVSDPSSGGGAMLDSLTTKKIRRVWFKELCMARCYLDLSSPLV